MSIALQLDDVVRHYFVPTNGSTVTAEDIASEAFQIEPTDAFVAGRCLTAIDRATLPSEPLQERARKFQLWVRELARRYAVLDLLGDDGVSPAILFDYLGAAADELIEDVPRDELEAARSGASTRIEAAHCLLTRFAAANLVVEGTAELLAAAEALNGRADRFQTNALFAQGDTGFVLGTRVHLTGSAGDITAFATADPDMAHQARLAIREAVGPTAGVSWNLEWPVKFEGESIGMAAYVAAQVAAGNLRSDPLLACTGKLDIGGPVLAVSGISAKLRAAARSGIRRVLLPSANEPEAAAVIANERLGLQLLAIGSLNELREKLAAVIQVAEPTFSGAVRFAASQIRLEPVSITAQEPRGQFHRFWIEDLSGRVPLDLYTTGKVVVPPTGSARSALEAARRAKLRIEGPDPEPRQQVTVNIPPQFRERLRSTLVEIGAASLPTTNEYEAWRFQLKRGRSRALAVLYSSGKLHLPAGQAPSFDELVAAIGSSCPGLAGLPKPSAPLVGAAFDDPDYDEAKPHIGTDEAGKGDFFGPLVTAAVFVDAEVGRKLRQLGVRDSKTLGDKAVRRLAGEIKRITPGAHRVTQIPPATYNRRYAEFRAEGKNLNGLLAWAHARSMEDLMQLRPSFVLSDQFGDPKYIEQKLLKDTRESGVKVIQRPRAEADIAVAAASVLARDAFLEWLDRAKDRDGKVLPRGASPAVVERAREIYLAGGDAALDEVAKTSFKTILKVKA